MAEDTDRSLWFGTNEGELPWPIDRIVQSKRDGIWAATAWGALHLGKQGPVLYTTADMAAALQPQADYVELQLVPDTIIPAKPFGVGAGINVTKGGYLGATRGSAPMVVWALAPQGPAATAGLRLGDHILSIGGKNPDLPHLPLGGAGDSNVVLKVARAGTTATFDVVRGPTTGTARGFSLSDLIAWTGLDPWWATPEEELQYRALGLEPDQPTFRLLVVEDRPEDSRLLATLLEQLGFAVRLAHNGQQGIEQWEEWQPHLIWMDMRMPVMDGYEATRRIKATGRGQATAVIALTASSFEEERTLILSTGCDDFVRKPFRQEEIVDKLAQHLGARFVYAEPETEKAQNREQTQTPLTRQDLAQLPAAWMSAFGQAISTADSSGAVELIQEIEGEHPNLAATLTTMVRDFRFDQLMILCQADI